jgi:carboxylesterase
MMPTQMGDYRSPFTFDSESAHDAVLLIHGFTGSTYDTFGLGEYLASLGFRVRGVLLPGHATEPADLNKVSRRDWLNTIEAEWAGLTGRKHIIGLSVGGVVGAYLTAKRRIDPTTLTLISTPIYYPKSWLHRWIIPWLYQMKKYSKKYWIKPDQFEWYRQRGKYTVIPLHGSLEAYRLVEETRPLLGQIESPTLIIHSRKDPVVATKCVETLKRNIKHSTVWWSDVSEHRLLDSESSQDLYLRIGNFIKSNSAHG